jgi:hypothetical protein
MRESIYSAVLFMVGIAFSDPFLLENIIVKMPVSQLKSEIQMVAAAFKLTEDSERCTELGCVFHNAWMVPLQNTDPETAARFLVSPRTWHSPARLPMQETNHVCGYILI